MRETLEGLYDQFVGRDLFAKIGPGAIVLVAVVWYTDLDLPEEVSAADWAFAVVLSWLAGLGIQSLGEIEYCGRWRLLRYYPKAISDEKWHDDVGFMLELPGYKDKYRAGYERLIVIKEACGVSYIALSLAVLIVACRQTVDYFAGCYTIVWSRELMLAAVVVALILLLRRMHVEHLDRQYDYVQRVIVRAKQAAPQKDDNAGKGGGN